MGISPEWNASLPLPFSGHWMADPKLLETECEDNIKVVVNSVRTEMLPHW
jgi:hypothetical protein